MIIKSIAEQYTSRPLCTGFNVLPSFANDMLQLQSIACTSISCYPVDFFPCCMRILQSKYMPRTESVYHVLTKRMPEKQIKQTKREKDKNHSENKWTRTYVLSHFSYLSLVLWIVYGWSAHTKRENRLRVVRSFVLVGRGAWLRKTTKLFRVASTMQHTLLHYIYIDIFATNRKWCFSQGNSPPPKLKRQNIHISYCTLKTNTYDQTTNCITAPVFMSCVTRARDPTRPFLSFLLVFYCFWIGFHSWCALFRFCPRYHPMPEIKWWDPFFYFSFPFLFPNLLRWTNTICKHSNGNRITSNTKHEARERILQENFIGFVLLLHLIQLYKHMSKE